jgi:hypothetical protein
MEYHWRERSNLDRGNVLSYISFVVFVRASAFQEFEFAAGRGHVLVCGGASFLFLSIRVCGVCWKGMF